MSKSLTVTDLRLQCRYVQTYTADYYLEVPR